MIWNWLNYRQHTAALIAAAWAQRLLRTWHPGRLVILAPPAAPAAWPWCARCARPRDLPFPMSYDGPMEMRIAHSMGRASALTFCSSRVRGDHLLPLFDNAFEPLLSLDRERGNFCIHRGPGVIRAAAAVATSFRKHFGIVTLRIVTHYESQAGVTIRSTE